MKLRRLGPSRPRTLLAAWWTAAAWLALCLPFLLAACGNPTVAACHEWQESLLALECVPDDYAFGVDCEADFHDYPCDASPYFECLAESYSCSEEGDFVQPEANACAALQGC